MKNSVVEAALSNAEVDGNSNREEHHISDTNVRITEVEEVKIAESKPMMTARTLEPRIVDHASPGIKKEQSFRRGKEPLRQL